MHMGMEFCEVLCLLRRKLGFLYQRSFWIEKLLSFFQTCANLQNGHSSEGRERQRSADRRS